MHIVRFVSPLTDAPAVGVDDGEHVVELAGVTTVGELLRLPAADLRERCSAADGARHPSAAVRRLAPVDGLMEVWAAGVTYRRSREARVVESERSADVYELVYDAERPELFFKSVAWKVSGDGGRISVRADSEIDVPEPELGLVLNAAGEIAGYTVVDDVSSRSIEGVNPLYLPQAKIYLGGCAVGPAIRPAWEVPDPYALEITLTIVRAGETVWDGKASTSELNRRLDDLAAYLFRADDFPDGVILATGTSLVPDLPFTLADGDTVTIGIDEIGTLTTTVVRGLAAMR
ncbi:fumarylacetoacetate hydrolase family protein [Nonomuraea jiangxiensis]|uniref:2-dehydro-3-deoxy-D-arabinonate dehydratase n=1 Tax=Nonomuraea jiangxiensis TaxID=633440 RepID=A0A1G7ZB14_9ACTN|nr:fumarylacetoacetate hydrolase family protein [Nonomuraea jiangxiensis]SDH05931.1 2-dehydro-3-deoxy-D-arabinonate dehydratase [Nonomuraea jiangxiensis]